MFINKYTHLYNSTIKSKFVSKYLLNLKYSIFALTLFIVLIFFINNVQNTIASGLDKQENTENLKQEIKNLEKENNRLSHLKDVYTSNVALESQIRNVEGKKKEGEDIYIVAFSEPSKLESLLDEIEEKRPIKDEKDESNFKQWLKKIFN